MESAGAVASSGTRFSVFAVWLGSRKEAVDRVYPASGFQEASILPVTAVARDSPSPEDFTQSVASDAAATNVPCWLTC
ncbi:MAG: hypothetical protein CME21_22075 [Gemmatimonadetes bacterium]|nr:hypothetical protein [Gemmatimonadota bacterium]